MRMWILAAVMMMMGVTVMAQHGERRHEPLKPEQKAEVASKKMTLALNLNEKQQKDVQKLFLDKARKNEQARAQRKADSAAGKKATADDRFAMMNRRLDERIAMKAEIKKVLTAEQFSKWETMNQKRNSEITKRHKNFKKGHRR